MASGTFNVAVKTDGLIWSQELPTSAVTGHPYLDHVAALAIFNKTSSNKILRIKAVAVNNIASVTVTATSTIVATRITALTGGDAITPISLDSNNAALPSQVSCVTEPATVTTTGSSLLRVNSLPALSTTQALGFMASSRGSHHRLGSGQLYQHRDPTNDSQMITLREGEGIALSPESSNCNYPHGRFVSFWVRNSSSGACYIYSAKVSTSNLPLMALLNGSGSGVVLQVFNIEWTEFGENLIRQISLEGIDSADLSTCGEALTPVSLDSTNSLSGSILVYKNASVKTGGANDGAMIVIPQRKRIVGPSPSTGPGLTTNIPVSITPNYIFKSSAPDYDIILREGKGIGVFLRNPGNIGRFDLNVTFVQEDVSGAGGSPVTTAYAWVG